MLCVASGSGGAGFTSGALNKSVTVFLKEALLELAAVAMELIVLRRELLQQYVSKMETIQHTSNSYESVLVT